jgi:hypothetical protein
MRPHCNAHWCTKSVTGVVACDQNGPPTRRDEGAYLNRYVTEEQRRRRPIFIATLRAARLLAGCFVAHQSKTKRVFSLFASRIQPKYAAAPLPQSLTWCTRRLQKESPRVDFPRDNPTNNQHLICSNLAPFTPFETNTFER